MIPDIDWPALSQTELDQLLDAFNAELKRRHLLSTADSVLDELGTAVLTGEGLAPGEPWRQPVTVGYPHNWPVTHNGKTWVSTVANNVWEPGVSGWREETPDGTPAQWLQPTGAHDAYQIGDLVTFQGQVYRSVINNNVWSPTGHPAGWELVP